MLCKTCAFETDRLDIKEWQFSALNQTQQHDFALTIAGIFTEAVTKSLPEAWQGKYTVQRAFEWAQAREAEGTTLIVAEKPNTVPIGLMILFEVEQQQQIEVRLGYLLAEAVWNQGLASELIKGFVQCCRAILGVYVITGGVAKNNLASQRVLEKNGFALSEISNPSEEGIWHIKL